MRLIVACSKCKRQYDASGRDVGTRFRCHCGEGLQVAAPQGHDAAVVRCSSCGAPRETHAAACTFCSADFTIHEQDMHTVCPGCLAIISDAARYCHHCGLGIQPEQAAGEATLLPCPECGDARRLVSRALGQTGCTAMECQRCGGLWLGSETFQKLVALTAQNAIPSLAVLAERASLTAANTDSQWRYRPCPICRDLMPRKNYARGSKVILDICGQHGIWFDANELPRILQWIRQGGLKTANRRDAEEAREIQRRRDLDRIAGYRDKGDGEDVNDILVTLVRLFW